MISIGYDNAVLALRLGSEIAPRKNKLTILKIVLRAGKNESATKILIIIPRCLEKTVSEHNYDKVKVKSEASLL